MPPAATASHRGILRPQEGFRHFALERRPPVSALAGHVERFWTVTWDLRGRAPYTQHLLNHPTINVAVEPEGAAVFGIRLERDSRRLEGTGWAVGAKFRPGAFFPWWGEPVHRLTDRAIPLAAVFGGAGDDLAEAVRAAPAEERVGLLEAFLRERMPPPDPNVELIGRITQTMLEDPAVVRVAGLAHRHGLTPRTLQRLFRRYVGVGPKWVLRRYRLHEAAERIAEGREGDWAATALELGYFDQAHFIRDFKALVGAPPGEYAGRVATA